MSPVARSCPLPAGERGIALARLMASVPPAASNASGGRAAERARIAATSPAPGPAGSAEDASLGGAGRARRAVGGEAEREVAGVGPRDAEGGGEAAVFEGLEAGTETGGEPVHPKPHWGAAQRVGWAGAGAGRPRPIWERVPAAGT